MKISFIRTFAVVAMSLLTLAGCADTAGERDRAAGTTQMRTDIEPLAGRLPVLGVDFTAQWFGDIVGDESVPGPATYWVEALVTPAAGVDSLIANHDLTAGTPDVDERLRELLPTCAWERSDSIDRAWGPLDWETRVWFCREHGQLVVSLLGGN